ncbi:unnamed protein product [Litomosoides sigmodontis]|uniref:Globin family profile domain-containing protein n=1 Tax=Litomosoides sigmodontis TaxID=42156 RepID=A0A3P7JTS6_LITSI|nr:unnamed protein product [Litomosoides sigmodontis]
MDMSISLNSSYPLNSSAQVFTHEFLTKPQSVSTSEKFKSSDALDDRKKSKDRSSATGSSSLQSKRNSQNSKKVRFDFSSIEYESFYLGAYENESVNILVIRRPHSTDIVKSSQTASSGSSGRRSGRMTPTMQRPSVVPTTKSSYISPSSQSIILFCMDNARSDIALRIVQRMAHKRDDFAQFYANLNSEQTHEFVLGLKKFLNDIVRNITNSDKIRQISSKYGIEQAHKRSWGFKADFFSLLADALTTECVFLDGAAHQPTETIEAWATLVELMFTNVRDGYYMETRQLRRTWYNFRSQSNLSSQSDQSLDGDSPQSLHSLNHMFTPSKVIRGRMST